MKASLERNAADPQVSRSLRIQIAQKEQVELPYVRDMQQAAAQWRAENVPTVEQKLEDRLQRREAINARALEIVEEREAQALADRIAKERRLSE